MQLQDLVPQWSAMKFDIPRLDGIAIPTGSKYLSRADINRKEKTPIPRNQDPLARIAFRDRMSRIEPINILDFDGNQISRNKVDDKYAWSEKGTPAYREQLSIVILGLSFSMLALYLHYVGFFMLVN